MNSHRMLNKRFWLAPYICMPYHAYWIYSDWHEQQKPCSIRSKTHISITRNQARFYVYWQTVFVAWHKKNLNTLVNNYNRSVGKIDSKLTYKFELWLHWGLINIFSEPYGYIKFSETSIQWWFLYRWVPNETLDVPAELKTRLSALRCICLVINVVGTSI